MYVLSGESFGIAKRVYFSEPSQERVLSGPSQERVLWNGESSGRTKVVLLLTRFTAGLQTLFRANSAAEFCVVLLLT